MSTSNTPSAQGIEKLHELIKDVRVAMLLTFRSDGTPRARPMYTQTPLENDNALWFMTDATSAKLDELNDDPKALLTYSDPKANRYAVVNGHATIVHDPAIAKRLWNIHAQGWYPGGPDDPSLRLIRVEPIGAEWWDGPSNTSYFIHLAKAIVTGTRAETASGEHGQVGRS